MAQHDMVIDNADGLTVRTDLNAAMNALTTCQSGTVAPNPSYPGQLWLDLSAGGDGIMRQRNQANTLWVPILMTPEIRFGTPDLYFGARTAPNRFVWNDKFDGSGTDRMTLREDGLLTLVPTGAAIPGASDVVNKAYVDSGSVPIGTVISVAMTTAPTNYLKCNGASLLRAGAYNALFLAIGTAYGTVDITHFSLPDLRGEFIRGWDDSRGVDSGRVFGTSQGDLYENHAHTASSGINSVDHTHTFSDASSATGNASANHAHTLDGVLYNPGAANSFGFDNVSAGPASTNPATSNTGAAHTHTVAVSGTTNTNSADHTHTITVAASTTGGTETRPRNVTLMHCIKYQ
jgi:microcystin-dependent protein